MIKKKFIIVGGGITGCIAALHAKKKGFDVEIYEKFNQLGGILKDDFKNDFFISGCQYLNTEAKWFKLIDDLNEDFVIFKAKYGSYTKLKNQIEIFSDYFQGPVFPIDKISTKSLSERNIYGSLLSRIQCYGHYIEKNIKLWLNKNVVDFENLNYSSLIPLGLKRFSVNKNLDDLLEIKKKNQYIDELYGLSREKMGLDDLYQAIPSKGYTKFFLNLNNFLLKKGIIIKTNSLIKIKKNNNNFDIFNFNKKLNFDYVLWAASPTPVIAKLENKILDTKPILVTNYCFKYNGNLPNFFIQVFDDKIFRVNCFSLKKNQQLVVECFDDNLDPKKIINESKMLLKRFRINLLNKNTRFISKFLKKRYIVISNNDYKTIQKFKKKKK